MNSKAYKSYKISKNEYRELKYFCLRYHEMKKYVEEHEQGCFDDDKYWLCLQDVILIDGVLEIVTDSDVIHNCLFKSVTENIGYDRLNIPMGRQQFYELRRKFFYILHNSKMG